MKSNKGEENELLISLSYRICRLRFKRRVDATFNRNSYYVEYLPPAAKLALQRHTDDGIKRVPSVEFIPLTPLSL